MLTPSQAAPEFVVDAEYLALWEEGVASGREVAQSVGVNVLAIARNCMPHLTNTIECINEAVRHFRWRNLIVYENDSDDDTPSILRDWGNDSQWKQAIVQSEKLGRNDLRGFEDGRTIALAEYRNRCLNALRTLNSRGEVTIVVDLDPHGGFEPAGVLNSVGWLGNYAGLASFSIFRKTNEDGVAGYAHYDCWAMRPVCWWRDRKLEIGFNWAGSFLPPVGAPPQPFNSAFGGLAVYNTNALLTGRYAGGDCEHVALHRSMAAAGYRMAMNPGCVYCAVLG